MIGKGTSLSFDRAASYYDRTRALSPEAERRVVEVVREQLAGRGRCLEIGVGTGRVALPLAAAGIAMAGVDLSWPMLSRLVVNAGDRIPFPIAQADATKLPFATGSFGAALGCHVLHLIPNWRGVLAEIVRVVEPGGVFLNDLGGWTDATGPWRQIHERFAAEAGLDLRHRGAREAATVNDAMGQIRARARRLPAIFDSRKSTLKGQMDGLAEGLWSFTWQVPEATRRAAVEKVRTWAYAHFGDPEARIEVGTEIAWTAYDLR